jgi:hypothetical protein
VLFKAGLQIRPLPPTQLYRATGAHIGRAGASVDKAEGTDDAAGSEHLAHHMWPLAEVQDLEHSGLDHKDIPARFSSDPQGLTFG